MSQLTKSIGTAILTPAKEGTPGFPGRPAIPARCYLDYYTVCSWKWQAPRGGHDEVPIPGSGYDGGTWLYECEERAVENCTDYVPEVPSIPAEPPTPAELIQIFYPGWISSSRSAYVLNKGNYIEFTLASGLVGAFVCIGYRSLDDKMPSQFTHTLLTDPSGSDVIELNENLQTLTNIQLTTTTLRIYRSSDNEIYYMSILADGTTSVYKSTSSPGLRAAQLVVYAKLYYGGDISPTAEFKEGEIVFGEVKGDDKLSGLGSVDGYAGQYIYYNGYGTITTWGVPLKGVGTLSLPNIPCEVKNLTGKGYMAAFADKSNDGYADIGPVLSIGAEDASLIDRGVADLAPLQTPYPYINYGGEYEPAVAQGGFNWFQALVSVGVTESQHYMSGDADLHPILSKGWELSTGGEGGSGDVHHQQNLGGLFSLGLYPSLIVPLIEMLVVDDVTTSNLDTLIIITDTGQITDTIVGSKVSIEDMIDSMEGSSLFTVLGTINIDMIDDISGSSVSLAQVIQASLGETEPQPSLDGAGRVWCVNIETNASSQYENYGFNSFFERDGDYYGVADDGIYLLEGDEDIGAKIESVIDFGKRNFEIPQNKRITDFYAGVASDGRLLLKVTVDNGEEYIYEMRNHSEKHENHKFNLGRGLKGNYWQFILVNQDGEDFDLADIQFEIIPLSRKI